MRKETAKIVNAFMAHKPAAAARTMTDGQAVYLHGHKIFWRDDNSPHCYHFTMCGWPTRTTRDRIDALLMAVWFDGFERNGKPIDNWAILNRWGVFQRKHCQWFRGHQGENEINPHKVYSVAA